MYIGVDIGGTKTLVVAFSEEGVILKKSKQPTDANFDLFIENLKNQIHEVSRNKPIKAIGLAAPGIIDKKTRKFIVGGNLPWKNVDILEPLKTEFPCPIALDNDANVGALNEARRGAATGFNEVLYVTISTGIGTGVTVGGRIDPALADSEGGQMHFRHDGRLMRWEHFASGKAFYERFGKMGKDQTDPKVWDEWASDVSLGIGSLLAIIRPEIVVIGGSMGTHLRKYKTFLVKHLEDTRSPLYEIPPIVPAADPENAVINGCYVLAKDLTKL